MALPTPADSGFVVRSEHEVFRGAMIRLVLADVEAPDGDHLERAVVRHPGAVAVVPVHDDRTVSLVRQYRTAVDDLVLEAPAGTRDVDGEPPEGTAGRELAEEAGLKAAELRLLVSFYNSPGYCDQETMVFLATGLREVATSRSGAEESRMEVVRIPLDEVPTLTRDGTIVDGQTLIGLHLALQALPRG